jgi:hypothetical protein
MTTERRNASVDLHDFTSQDWSGWQGAEKPDGFEPKIAEIKVIGLPPFQWQGKQQRYEETGVLIVDANGITINFFNEAHGFVSTLHKGLDNFSLAVVTAQGVLRQEMQFNVLQAIGFEYSEA